VREAWGKLTDVFGALAAIALLGLEALHRKKTPDYSINLQGDLTKFILFVSRFDSL
jgi:hypothetical protein